MKIINNLRFSTIVFFFTLLIISCGENTDSAEQKQFHADWKTLDGPLYSIQYPKNWTLDVSGKNGSIFFLYSPIQANNDLYQENVHLVVQDLAAQKINLQKYVEISEAQIENQLTDGYLFYSEPLQGELPGYKMIYSAKQDTASMKFLSYVWVRDEKAFLLTLTCLLSTYDQFESMGESILRTFTFRNS